MAAQTDTNDHIVWEKYSQWCSKCCYSLAGSYSLKYSDKSCVLDIVVATNIGAFRSPGVPHAQKTQTLLLTSNSVPLVFEGTAAIFSPLLTSFLLGQFMYSLGEQAQSPPPPPPPKRWPSSVLSDSGHLKVGSFSFCCMKGTAELGLLT